MRTYEYGHKKIILPQLPIIWENSDYYIIWKIKIDDIYSNPFIKFIINTKVTEVQ